MPTSPNIFSWLTDPQFCGTEGFVPWARQIYVLVSVLEEFCPMSCCTDMRFFQTMFKETLDQVQERVTFLNHGVCPRCGVTKAELLDDGLFHGIRDVALCMGQRSSKTSMIAGMLLNYVLHQYVQLPKHPAKVLGLKPGQELYATLVAQSAKQAFKYPWTDFKNIYDTSTWFREYNKELSQLAEREGWGISPVKALDTLVEYKHKHLYVGYEPPNKRSLRGATRFFAMIDEFGWFSEDDTRETASASETEDALGNALLTVRKAVTKLRRNGTNHTLPIPMLCMSSSPHYVGDPIMRAVSSAKRSKRSFYLHCATWEFNPEMEPPTVPGSEMAEEFAKRPEDAERSFGANPPMAKSPFHRNKAIFPVLPRDYSPVLKYVIEPYRDQLGIDYVYPKLKFLGTDLQTPYVLSCDPGATKNSFGITLQHLTPEGDGVVDAVIKVQPNLDSGAVHFPKVLEDCLFLIIERFNVLAVVYDRWNSITHVNQINDNEEFASRVKAVRMANPKMVRSSRDPTPTIGGAVQQTLVYADFLEFSSRLQDVQLPRLERPWSSLREMDLEDALRDAPVLELLFQTATVRDTGAKVTKPAVGDDDLYRSMVNGFTYMWEPNRLDMFIDHSGARLQKRRRQSGFMVVRSRGNRSGASGLGATGNSNIGVVRLPKRR